MQRVASYLLTGVIFISTQATHVWAAEGEQVCTVTETQREILDPSQVYDVDRLSFDIFRGRSKVGIHEVVFSRQGSGLVVDSKTEIGVNVLLIPVYRYDYTSREIWCGEELREIATTVVENGEESRVTAMSTETGLNVLVDDQFVDLVATDIYTTNHWNSGVLSSSEVFNTITGRMNQIEISSAPLVGQDANIKRYRFEGELNIDVAYDQEGRWVGLYFKDKRGADIEFRCVQCGGDPSTYASLVQ